ncbi:MAG: glycosyl transferase family 28 [Bacteroidota bacterium]|nr:glycosyl transferase family 28 [Bacteroidota bacterium]
MRSGNKFNTIPQKPKILVTPLDWGLGHATRCIPIINELISLNCEVLIAASGDGYFLLKKEFPTTVIFRIPGYKIEYSRKKKWLPFKLLLQSPRLFFSIFKEYVWLKKAIKNNRIHAVVSDNRFGMFAKNIPCVYITHQLLIKTGNSFSENFLQRIHYSFIKKFNYCWVPDYAQNGIAGELSHQANKPGNVLYAGPLSRFEIWENMPLLYDVIVSISGPEPQRTIFEKIILSQIKSTAKKILVVRGLPGEDMPMVSENASLKIVNHLSSHDLNKAFQQSEIVISRSGYTTVMDLVKLGKKAVLVPTPGQTEQEYVAYYLMKNKFFYSVEQDNFSVNAALNAALSFPFTTFSRPMDDYKKIINEFVLSVKSGNFATR